MGRKVGRKWISGYISSQGFVKPFLGQDMLFPGDNQDAYTLVHSDKDKSLGYPLSVWGVVVKGVGVTQPQSHLLL